MKEDRRSLGALRRRLGELEEQISQTGRESQMKFMETGLDVEAAREVVLGQLRELEGNLSSAAQQAQDRDNDVDYLCELHSPCGHGGACSLHQGQAVCDCSNSGYKGSYCQEGKLGWGVRS